MHSPSATAEIEGPEGEMISIDSPAITPNNIPALLQEVTPLPTELNQKIPSTYQFISYFISVLEETDPSSVEIDSHVTELLQEYQQKNEDIVMGENKPGEHEKYEKSSPAHGDKMFHHFLSKIQANPGQILR